MSMEQYFGAALTADLFDVLLQFERYSQCPVGHDDQLTGKVRAILCQHTVIVRVPGLS